MRGRSDTDDTGHTPLGQLENNASGLCGINGTLEYAQLIITPFFTGSRE